MFRLLLNFINITVLHCRENLRFENLPYVPGCEPAVANTAPSECDGNVNVDQSSGNKHMEVQCDRHHRTPIAVCSILCKGKCTNSCTSRELYTIQEWELDSFLRVVNLYIT